ncbi:MAG TPA: MerR family transcriptional regulator [Chloroflexia bacterium]|nr:MerR family transcriptional regulator [Chloroflexia bacterium]
MGRKEGAGDTYISLREGQVPNASVQDTSAPEHEYLQIGDVAQLTNLTQRTLRYYEELELLDPPTRTAGDFRLYSPRDLARLQHILRLKQLLGFSLSEIKAIIRAEEAQTRWQSRDPGPGGARRRLEQIGQVIANTAGQLHLLERKIAEMEVLRGDLADRLAEMEATREALLVEYENAERHAASEYS